MCEFLRLRASEFAHLRKKTTYFPGGLPRVTARWPIFGVNHPLTYFRWPTYGVNHPLTYLRWPTSGDLLSVTTRWPRTLFFLAMTSLWPWSHTSRIPRSHTASLSSRTQPFFIFFFLIHIFFMIILVHGSSKGLFCGPFRVCLFCFNFSDFF